ncbi:MAG: ABC transporter permease [Actinomycetota bacterium]
MAAEVDALQRAARAVGHDEPYEALLGRGGCSSPVRSRAPRRSGSSSSAVIETRSLRKAFGDHAGVLLYVEDASVALPAMMRLGLEQGIEQERPTAGPLGGRGVLVFVAVVLGVRLETGLLGLLLILLTAALLTMSVTAAFSALAYAVPQHGTFFAVAGFVSLPLLFMSNAFVPLEAMPVWMEIVARLNPLTYGMRRCARWCSRDGMHGLRPRWPC